MSEIGKVVMIYPNCPDYPFEENGLLQCDGHMLLIVDYPELFAAIGNVYGGDAIETFKLPTMEKVGDLYTFAIVMR